MEISETYVESYVLKGKLPFEVNPLGRPILKPAWADAATQRVICSKDSYLLALHQEKHRRFDVDDDDTEALKLNSLEAKPLAVDNHDGMLVWLSDAATAPQNTLTRVF